MIKVLVYLMLAAGLYGQVEQAADPYDNIRYFQLDNGLDVYLLGDEKAETTQIGLSVAVGWDVEDEASSGLSHLVEHIVFRDARVPHRDYLDYFNDEGAMNVNGFTERYQTYYTATIGGEKSYWLAAMFAQMVFDKNVSSVDLEAERGALQTEIGECLLPEKIVADLVTFLQWTMPPQEDFFADQYGLSRLPVVPPMHYAKCNNMHFTLEEVRRHYDRYYYPSNMILKIAGRFDGDEMEQTVRTAFAAYDRRGTAKAEEPHETARLNHRPVFRFYEVAMQNQGIIGAKYLLDDYGKYLILDAYTADASDRLQQLLRNQMGQNYTVYPYMFNERGAGVAAVYFDGLRDSFEENMARVNALLSDDAERLDDETAREALRKYRERVFLSQEHDSETLMNLLGGQEYLKTEHNITDRSPYDIFSAISVADFKHTIAEVFRPENHYAFISRDYYFFPFDTMVLSLLATILLIGVYFYLHVIDYRVKKLTYGRRDVVFSRRLSNRFLGFLSFLFDLFVSMVVWEWIKYWLSILLTGDPYFPFTIDVPFSYALTILDALIMILLFALIFKYGLRYYARLEADDHALYLVGNNIDVIDFDEIVSVDVVAWHPGLILKTKGLSLGFWKSLVLITTRDGTKVYLRAVNARHLKEDIEKRLGA